MDIKKEMVVQLPTQPQYRATRYLEPITSFQKG
jgi:hypothetical protein